jgi:hypothetical protein
MDKEMMKTMVFIFCALLVIIFIVAASGMLDKRSEDLRSRAEFICWQNGYLNGADKVTEYSGMINFTCKGDKLVVYMKDNGGRIYGKID